MHSSTAHLKRHNQEAGIEYKNICVEYGLKVPGLKWATPPNLVTENEQAKILWDSQIQTDKVAYQLGIDVDKQVEQGEQGSSDRCSNLKW